VKVVADGDPDRKSRELTLEILQYVHARLPVFKQMGLAVKVNKMRSLDLRDARLVNAMRKRGIKSLPALTTPNNVYHGCREICDLYERNFQEFQAFGRRGEKPVEGVAPEDDLDVFYRDEMTFERAEEDAEETGLGEADDMMDAYRRVMERRERSEAGRRPSSRPAKGPSVAADDRRAAPPRPPASSRPDNVGMPSRRAAPLDPDDAEIQATIDRLAQDIDDNVHARAFASGGGDSLDGGEGADFQDDLMERAYWSSRVDSTEL
jgi:hypothetical protein